MIPDSFYFLHIPKTGGRYFYRHVIKNIQHVFDTCGISNIDYRRTDSQAHSGWHKNIKDSTYIFTSFRDPVKQVASLWTHAYTGDGHYNIDLANRKNFMSDLIQNGDMYFNNQAKHLCFSENIDMHAFKCPQPDLDLAMERLERIDRVHLLDSKMDNVILAKRILTDMGYPYVPTKDPHRTTELFGNNSASSRLYESLREEDKEFILSKSTVDLPLYNHIKYNRLK